MPKCEECPGRSHPRCCWNFENAPQSEVAQLMARIAAEHEAAQRGITGLAAGTARHEFIRTHYARIDTLQSELSAVIGHDAAMTAVCEIIES